MKKLRDRWKEANELLQHGQHARVTAAALLEALALRRVRWQELAGQQGLRRGEHVDPHEATHAVARLELRRDLLLPERDRRRRLFRRCRAPSSRPTCT